MNLLFPLVTIFRELSASQRGAAKIVRFPIPSRPVSAGYSGWNGDGPQSTSASQMNCSKGGTMSEELAREDPWPTGTVCSGAETDRIPGRGTQRNGR